MDEKEYDVWMEGYSATGERDVAKFMGSYNAKSFAHACHICMCLYYLKIGQERWDYDPKTLSYWGMRLFENEVDARKSFG
jgi:hypothetical protein